MARAPTGHASHGHSVTSRRYRAPMVELAWSGAYLAALCTYSVLWVLVAVGLVVLMVCAEAGWTLKKVFHVLMLVCMSARVVQFSIDYAHPGLPGEGTAPTKFNIILGGLPGYLFFSTYLLLILQWAQLQLSANNSLSSEAAQSRAKRFFITANAAIYICVFIIYIVVLLPLPPSEQMLIHYIEAIFACVLNLSAAIAMTVFGGRLYCALIKSPLQSTSRQKITLNLFYIVIICTVCFTIRVALIILWDFGPATTPTWPNFRLNQFCVNVTVEVVPTLLMLYVFRFTRRAPTTDSVNSITSPSKGGYGSSLTTPPPWSGGSPSSPRGIAMPGKGSSFPSKTSSPSGSMEEGLTRGLLPRTVSSP